MIVNTDIWGEPVAYYEKYNIRTGATDLNDPDFEDYPPFTYSNIYPEFSDPLATSYPYTLRAGIAKGTFTPDTKLPDYSIAYVGMLNPDLPQTDIVCVGQSPTCSAGELEFAECFQSDPNEVLPIAFISCDVYRKLRSVNTYPIAIQQFNNPLFKTSQGNYNNGKYYYSPHSREGDTWPTRNICFDMAYWRSIGLRSVIGMIYVKYIDAELNETSGLPTRTDYSPMTLHAYESQTTEWREAHPITAAYMALAVRNSTAGNYASTNKTDSIMPDLTVNIKANPEIISEEFDTVSPVSMIGDFNNIMYCPICGYVGAMSGYGGGVTPQIASTSSSGGMTSGNYPMFIGYHSGVMHYGAPTGNSTQKRTCFITFDGTGSLEWIRRGAAAYGLFFTDGNPSDYPTIYGENNDTYRWVNENMCLGIVDENGYTNGDYTRGMSNPTAPNFTWKDTTQSPYNPSIPPNKDNTQYSDTTDWNVLGGIANCNKMYACRAVDIAMLAQALSTALDLNAVAAEPMPVNEFSLQTFLVNNPLDCIVSLRKYPVDNIVTGTAEPIKFGTYSNATVTGIPTIKSYEKILFKFSVASKNALYPHFGDFRDYEPYTHAELIVPFCGTVQINPCDFIGHDINVHMIIDYITGACTAYIAADGLVVTSISGSIGVDVPLSGIQQATLESQRVNAVLNRKAADASLNNAIVGGLASSIGVVGSVASGNIMGTVASGAGLLNSINRIEQADIQYQKADYDLKHMQVPFKQVSAGSPIASTVIEHKCRLIIYRPVLDDKYNPEAYANTVGFACLKNGKVSEFSGLTVGNIKLDGLNVTEKEKQLIVNDFASGVYL